MGSIYESVYTVASGETDLFDLCRPSALLRFFQEAAGEHSVALGISREELIERHNAIWMLVRIRYELIRPIRGGETLKIRTWHRRAGGASMYRDFSIEAEGETVGEAVSLWVVADAVTHSLLRIGSVLPATEQTAVTDGKQTALPRLRMPGELAAAGVRTMVYSDADINGHVNNARYADILCDTIALDQQEGVYPKSMQIGYLAECRPGEKIGLDMASLVNQWFVKGADAEGKARFEGSLTLDKMA
ncbi:acyl-[acyl-carrier-protein] thioesterase [Papillibacter cinnamivorans]|uniref:Acyl-ACP thioesterase n=1 Tax=Papillibacter cinnamivorans DSM 12816 TaxID=1122930 RepID=A0A1W1ZIT2_9FIRM|nr:acyl-ACP thioesterase domain-containing protein [Papillibacter cinnamivorans]SMC47931.1 Acyl-ACP thioesterase [Papillibacter cinnamivorans DSM 12816]